jgi:hypothetical protein
MNSRFNTQNGGGCHPLFHLRQWETPEDESPSRARFYLNILEKIYLNEFKKYHYLKKKSKTN